MKKVKATLLKKIHGGQVCQIVGTAARLKIFDLFESNQPLSFDQIESNLPLSAPNLHRFLNALVHLNLLQETENQSYKMTEEGELLQSNNPQSLQKIAAYKGSPMVWGAMGKLYDGLMSGENPFQLAHNQLLFDYLDHNPEDFELFHSAMHFYEVNSSKQLLTQYDFSNITSLLDVGCGMGTFLNAIIDTHPHIKGAGFDLPKVVERAKGFTPHPLLSGSFFETIPQLFDAYVLRNILHDWSDEDAIRILKNIPSRILIFETVVKEKSRMGKFSDLSMFMLTNGGKERSLKDFEHLLSQSGFTIDQVYQSDSSSKTLIDAVKISHLS